MTDQLAYRFIADTTSATRVLDFIRSEFPAVLNHGRDAPCDDRCVCPLHRTPLIYWPAGEDHACQDVNCQFRHGMKAVSPPRPVGCEEKTA